MANKKDVAPSEVIPATQMPAFLQEKQGQPARGAEDVGTDDLVIPRLEVCQSLSACRDEDDALYIEGIKDGDLYNNLTRENYGRDVMVIPVVFEKEYLIWKDRNCLLYTSPSPRDQRGSRMPSSA